MYTEHQGVIMVVYTIYVIIQAPITIFITKLLFFFLLLQNFNCLQVITFHPKLVRYKHTLGT